MDVYLDAVFHPRAVTDEGWWVLRQEGWRYDVLEDDDNDRNLQNEKTTTATTVATTAGTTTLKTTTGTTTKATTTTTTASPQEKERPSDTRAKFEYKGVVFSEMKVKIQIIFYPSVSLVF
jgi:hypothetical protein